MRLPLISLNASAEVLGSRPAFDCDLCLGSIEGRLLPEGSPSEKEVGNVDRDGDKIGVSLLVSKRVSLLAKPLPV